MIFHNATKLKLEFKCGENFTNFFLMFEISPTMINFSCEFIIFKDFCASIGVVFDIPDQVVLHPFMDVDGPSVWVCVF